MNASVNGHFPSDALSAARYYLDRGIIPVPVPRQNRNKSPVILGWQNLRPKIDDLPLLFPASEPLNVGLLLGRPSGGLVDIDLDTQEAVIAAPFLLPATGWVSGRKGRPKSHWWYIAADPPNKAQEKFCDLDGTDLLEIRSSGGQTVAPPGIHESGEAIVWSCFDQPSQVGCAQLTVAAKSVAAAAILARHWPAQGARQDAFLALSGALLHAGWSDERVQKLVDAVIAATNDDEARKRAKTVAQTARKAAAGGKTTGWPTLERLLGPNGAAVIQRVCEWLGLSANTANGSLPWSDFVPLGDVPDVPLFPLDVLPGPFRQLVQEIAWAMNCPPDFAGVTVVVLAGGAIANSRQLQITPTHHQSACLYAGYVSRPGTTKSAPLKLLRRRLEHVQSTWLNEWRCQMEAWDDAEKDGRGPRPIPKRCIVSDITTESLGLVLCENPRGVLMIRNELAALVTGLNQYKAGKGHDRQVYLNLWDSDTIIIDRKSDKSQMGAPLYVSEPFTAIIGTLQPDVLSRLRGESFRGQPPPDDGFLDRFLIVYPNELPAVGELWRQVSVGALATWESAIDQLLGLTMSEREDGRPRPHTVRLTTCGRRAWEQFTTAHAAEVNAEQFPSHLVGPWAKLKGYAARLALIIHYLRWVTHEVTSDDVDGESMARGARLVEYFKGHARKIHNIIDSDPNLAGARRVNRWINEKQVTQFTKRDVFEALKGTFQRADYLDPVLETLERHGIIRPVAPPDRTGPGRKPSPQFEVHPKYHEGASQNSHNSQNSESNRDCANTANSANVVGEESAGENDDHETVPDSTVTETPYGSSSDPDTLENPEMRPPYICATDAEGLRLVAAALEESAAVALDVETTGLNPRTDRIRLLSLAVDTVDGGTFSYLIDCFRVDPQSILDLLGDKELIIHNAQFDLGFLARWGFAPRQPVHDTMLMASVLGAGTNERVSLAACTQRYLNRVLDKAEQQSDWSGNLTTEQLDYAALDVDVLKPLWIVLKEQIAQANLKSAVEIESRCMPAIVWMSSKGVGFDCKTWEELAQSSSAECARLRAELDAAAPTPPGSMFEGWNWDSPQQVLKALEAVGRKIDSTSDWKLAQVDHPLGALLRSYRAASKQATTYGRDWLKHVAADGRVYPHWRQLGAWSGRMSCSEPNMQQMPRGDHRRCVVAPPGRVLIKADYSQIELRLAAKIANETVMIEAYRRGDDLHTLTARQLLGKEDVTKSDRQLAKALNFGLLYGMGAKGLRGYARTAYGVELTEDESVAYRTKFFQTYPGLAAWHRKVGRSGKQPVETRTIAGRRLQGVKGFNEKLNTPVQGSGADGLKQALALLWERRDQSPLSFPIMAVHDEIVVEANAENSAEAETWLKAAMIDAMAPLAEPVPVEVEIAAGSSWRGS